MSKKTNIFKSIKSFIYDLKEASKAGYMKGYEAVKNNNSNAKINLYTPTETETIKILDSMNINDMLLNQIENLHEEISSLERKIDLLIKTNLDNQELIISLATTIEEITHALEVEGILASNDLDTIVVSESETTIYTKNDVMTSAQKFNSSNQETIVVNNDKKYTLN